MRISQKERDILYLSQLEANAPIGNIREYCRYQEHSIRYYIQRGLQSELIVPRCFINLSRLGYSQYQFYFSLSSEKKGARKKIIKALVDSENVSWLGQLGGDYQYGLNIASGGIREVADLLYSLCSKFGSVMMDKVMAARLSFKYYGNKYLSNKKRPVQYLSYEVTDDTVQIDELDHRLISAVTRTGRASSRFLSRELGVPQRTVSFRLKKLEENGVITGYYYELQSSRIGMQSFLLLVSMKTINSSVVEQLDLYCNKHPNVVLFIHSIGSWDFELGVEVESTLEVTRLVEDLYDNFGGSINWIRILPAFANLKVLEYPFVLKKSS